jgi:hypothetical protein
VWCVGLGFLACALLLPSPVLGQPSCLDGATSVETAEPSEKSYAFDDAGKAVDARDVHWFGHDKHALEPKGSEPGCWVGGDVEGPYRESSVYLCEPAHCPGGVCPTPCRAYHKSAGLRTSVPAPMVFEDLRVSDYGDGIDVGEYALRAPLTVRGAYLHDLHDDAIENDWGSSVTVLDSLLERVNTAFASRPRESADVDARGEVFEVRDTLVLLHAFPNSYLMRSGHGKFWKWPDDGTGPDFVVTDSTFAVTDYVAGLLLPLADQTLECEDNTLLWAGTTESYEAWIEDESVQSDGLTNEERAEALDHCYTIVVKPESQTQAAFLAQHFDPLVDAWKQTHPAAVRTPLPFACSDGVDNDLDGRVDFPEDLGCTDFTDDSEGRPLDADGDGHPAVDDCDDREVWIHPGAHEICDDGIDNDCDGDVDDDDASCSPISVRRRVEASKDDAEERVSSGGSVSLTSGDLELTEDGSKEQMVGVRFRDLEIPQGATIVDARIRFTVDESGSGSTRLTIEGERSDDADAFSTDDEDVSSRRRTRAAVDWDPDPWTGIGSAGADQRTPRLTEIVQEIVDRPGWSEGNAMVFVISGSGDRTAESYDGEPSDAPRIDVDYLEPCDDADGDGFACEVDCNDDDASLHPDAVDVCDGLDNDCDGSVDEAFDPEACMTEEDGICAAGTTVCEDGAELCWSDELPQEEICLDGLDNDCDGDTDFEDAGSCDPIMLSIPVAAGEDDAEERISDGGSVSLASSSLQLVEDGSRLQAVGLRFRNVELPRGAEILSARVHFTADEVDSGTARLTIEGEASDDADAFDRVDGDVTSRPRTTSSVLWKPAAWTSSGASKAAQRTRDLSELVQEIVDRPGWSLGNALVLIMTGDGTRTARSYDGTPDRAAVLEMEYLPPTP